MLVASCNMDSWSEVILTQYCVLLVIKQQKLVGSEPVVPDPILYTMYFVNSFSSFR